MLPRACNLRAGKNLLSIEAAQSERGNWSKLYGMMLLRGGSLITISSGVKKKASKNKRTTHFAFRRRAHKVGPISQLPSNIRCSMASFFFCYCCVQLLKAFNIKIRLFVIIDMIRYKTKTYTITVTELFRLVRNRHCS